MGLEAVGPTCDPTGGSDIEQGICWLRRKAYRRAVLAFAGVDDQRGGAAYREVAARMLQLHERAGRGKAAARRTER